MSSGHVFSHVGELFEMHVYRCNLLNQFIICLGFIRAWFIRDLNAQKMTYFAIATLIDIILIDVIWLTQYTTVHLSIY